MITFGGYLILAGQAVTFIGVILSVAMTLRNANRIQEVHLNINSRLDQLLAAEKSVSFAEGAARATSNQQEPPR